MVKKFLKDLLTKYQVLRLNRMNLNELMTKGQKLTNTETASVVRHRLEYLIQTECPYEIIFNHKVYSHDSFDSIVPFASVIPIPAENQVTIFIFVNSKLNIGMPREVLQAIVAHEIGHIKLGHLSDLNKAEKIMEERFQMLSEQKVHQSEIDADAYACSIVGADAVIKALDYMAQTEFATDLDKIEVAQRIEIIKQ